MKLYKKLLSGTVATTLLIATSWAMSPASPETAFAKVKKDEASTKATKATIANVALEEINDNVGSSGIWSRDEAICSGMRVMIVDPDSVSFLEDVPRCRPFIGRVATVYEVTAEKSEKYLTILDEFGLGKVLERDVITLRRKDAAQQIDSRITKEYHGVAKAEFASLYDWNAANVAFQEELKRQPKNEELKTRYALFLSRANLLEDLAKLDLEEHQQDDSLRKVITAALLPQDQRVKRLSTIVDDEPDNVFARTELVSYLAFLISSDCEDSDSLYWTQLAVAHQVATLIKEHPVVFRSIFVTVQRALAGKTVDGNGFPAMMAMAEKSAERFPFNSDLTRSLALGHMAAADQESALKYTFETIEKFPADQRTIKTIEVFVSSGMTSGKMKRFIRRCPVETLVSTLTNTQVIGFDTGVLPSVRYIDGNPILTSEKTNEKDDIQGWKKLCVLDDLTTFGYLLANGYDLNSMAVGQLKELVEFSIEANSYHSLDFLLGQVNQKLAPVKADLFEFAVEEGAAAMLPVLCKHFGELPAAVRDSYATKSDIASTDVTYYVQKDISKILVSKMPFQFLSPNLNYSNLDAQSRKIESHYGQLEANAERLAIYGDSYGYQQSQGIIAELDRMLREIRTEKAACSRSAMKKLKHEFELVQTLLDQQGVDEWTKAVSEHVEQTMPWFKDDFETWNANRKSS